MEKCKWYEEDISGDWVKYCAKLSREFRIPSALLTDLGDKESDEYVRLSAALKKNMQARLGCKTCEYENPS
jgi:hypothetical protein